MSKWVKVNRDGTWAGEHGVGPAVRLKAGQVAEVPDYTAQVILEGNAGEYVNEPESESQVSPSENDEDGKSEDSDSGDDSKQASKSGKKTTPWVKKK